MEAHFGIVPLSYHLIASNWSHPDDIVKSYDDMMHESLYKFFSERCGHIKAFLRGAQHTTDRNFIINMQILGQDPVLYGRFSKDMLEKLPLLWIAVLAGYRNSTELLVRSGADVDEHFGCHDHQLIDSRWTVLHVLLQMDPSPENERLVRLVVDHGADLQARDSKGRSALHFAVMKDRVQLTEMLLDKGADVNVSDDMGMTPLLEAVNSCKADELVPLLMKHGADAYAKDIIGQNILHRLSAAPVEHVKLARCFIEKGVSLDDNDKGCINQYQPIHWATVAGHNELVKLYLDYGANVNAQALYGTSPLHLAAENLSNPAILETLLRRGADVLIEDCAGKTPFALMYPGDPSTRLMIKPLALKKVCEPEIELKDERIIEQHTKLRDYYQDCIEQVERAKSTRIVESCRFSDLLTKCHCQIAALMHDPEFESRFRLYDLSGFSSYAEDIVRTFERAKKLRQTYSRPRGCDRLCCSRIFNTCGYDENK